MSTPSEQAAPIPPTPDEVERLLVATRKAAGWSMRRAGGEFGVDHTQVHRWEHGAALEPIRYLLFLARSSEAARVQILRAMGGRFAEMEEPIAETGLAEWLAEARYAWEHRTDSRIEQAINTFTTHMAMFRELILRKAGNGGRGV